MFFGATLLIWFILLNATAFILMWLDRRRAQRGDWRIEEGTLKLTFLFGGAIGGKLAQQQLRHKTRKPSFGRVLNLLLLVNLVAYSYVSFEVFMGLL